MVALNLGGSRDMCKTGNIFDREGKPLTMKTGVISHPAPQSRPWGRFPICPAPQALYPAKSESLAKPKNNAKGTQDKIGFVPHFPCIFMKLNTIRAGKGPLDQTPNIQPLARNGYRPPPTWSHPPIKGLGHNNNIPSRCSPDGRPRYRTVLKSRRLTHHVDS